MLEQDKTPMIRAAIEEELSQTRAFADAPSTELEAAAGRIARAVAPYMARASDPAVEHGAT